MTRDTGICRDDEGHWNLSGIVTEIPTEWRTKILGFRVMLRDMEDTRIWSETANGLVVALIRLFIGCIR